MKNLFEMDAFDKQFILMQIGSNWMRKNKEKKINNKNISSITKTRLYSFYPRRPHSYIVK